MTADVDALRAELARRTHVVLELFAPHAAPLTEVTAHEAWVDVEERAAFLVHRSPTLDAALAAQLFIDDVAALAARKAIPIEQRIF